MRWLNQCHVPKAGNTVGRTPMCIQSKAIPWLIQLTQCPTRFLGALVSFARCAWSTFALTPREIAQPSSGTSKSTHYAIPSSRVPNIRAHQSSHVNHRPPSIMVDLIPIRRVRSPNPPSSSIVHTSKSPSSTRPRKQRKESNKD